MNDTNTTAAQPLDLDKLEALAKAASKGPWFFGDEFADNGSFSGFALYAEDGEKLIAEDIGPGKHDIEFMANANPATILALIAKARAAQPESATGTTGASVPTWQVRLLAHGFDSAQEAMEAEIADLRAQLAAKGQGVTYDDGSAYFTGPYADVDTSPPPDYGASWGTKPYGPASAQPADNSAGAENVFLRDEQGNIAGVRADAFYAWQNSECSVTAPTQPASAARCVVCGSDEPRTGTCGSDDPRALCNLFAPASAQPDRGVVQVGADYNDPTLACSSCGMTMGESRTLGHIKLGILTASPASTSDASTASQPVAPNPSTAILHDGIWYVPYQPAAVAPSDAKGKAEDLAGRVVSVDVSTGDEDYGNRIFAELTGETGSDGTTLLAIETERNFSAKGKADAGNAGGLLPILADFRRIIHDKEQPVGNRLQEIDARIFLLLNVAQDAGQPHVIAPARATEAMLRAAFSWREFDQREGLTGEADMFDRIYHAMLQAVPQLHKTPAADASTALSQSPATSAADAKDAARYRVLRQNVKPADVSITMTRVPPAGQSSAERIDMLCDLFIERNRAAMAAAPSSEKGGDK